MTINPNQVVILLLTALVGNALMLRLWRIPPTGQPSPRARWLDAALLLIFALALLFAGWEMYWNRSDDVMLGVLLYLPLQAILTAILFFRFNRRCGTPPGWGRLILGNLLLLIVPLAFTLAVGEIYFRFFYDTTDSIAYTKVAQRWIKRYYHHNQRRFRDNIEYSFTIAPGKRRVSFVGDSFTAGHGIKDVEDRFSNRIRRLHPEWEIHVLAGNGADTGGHLRLLESYTGRDYQLDEVVLVYCLNDITDLLEDWIKAIRETGGKVSRRLPFYDDSYFLDMLYYRFTIGQVPWIKNYFSFVRDAYRGAKWDEQKLRLQEIQRVVEQHGGRLSVVTFPFMNALGENYEYQVVHDKLDAFWRDQGVPHLDLLPVFKDYQPAQVTVNAFDAHPNEFANEIASRAINGFLLERLGTNLPPAAH